MIPKSVLIVTYGFPPHIKSLGGAIRMLKLAEFLQNSGCKVQVLCARTAHFDSFGYEQLLASLSVTYVDDPVAMAGARVLGARQMAPETPALPASGVKARLKRLVIDGLTPDTALLTISRMRRAARAIVAADPGMTVITSGPPHSIHLVGSWLKRRVPSIQWIADYRDSWNGSSLFRKRHALLQKLNEQFERRVLRQCDAFTYISVPMLGKAARWGGPMLRQKARLVANGFDRDLLEFFQERQKVAGPLKLGYFGAIDDGKDSYRNPECIFKVLAGHPELAVQLEFYGTIHISSEWKAKLGNRILIGPRLAHREVFETMAQMDALLLLHTREDGADEVVTGKVFEYVASGLPIVSIGPAEMAVNKLLEDDATFFRAEHTSAADIAAVLELLAASKATKQLPARDRRRLDSFSRERQFAGFIEIINQRDAQFRAK